MAGALFGFWVGALLVWAAVVLGVTVAFLITRAAFQDAPWSLISRHLPAIRAGVEKCGGTYLFLLRVSEVFPSFVINSAFAFTPMKTLSYVYISAVAVVPGVVASTQAGTSFMEINRLSELMEPALIGGLMLLGFLSLAGRMIRSRLSIEA